MSQNHIFQLRPATLLKKSLFSCKLCEIFKQNLFLQKIFSGCFWNFNEALKSKYWMIKYSIWISKSRSSQPDVFLVKGVLKICSKFTGEYPCRSVILIKLLQLYWNEITLRHGYSPVNLLLIFRTPFSKNTSASENL